MEQNKEIVEIQERPWYYIFLYLYNKSFSLSDANSLAVKTYNLDGKST